MRPAAPMGFAPAPRMAAQGFVPRPAVMPRPRPLPVPQRRGVFAYGQINGGAFRTTPGFGFRHRFHHRHSAFSAFPFYYGGYWPLDYADYWTPYYSFGSYSYDPAANTGSYNDLTSRVGELDAEIQQLREDNDSLRSTLDQRYRPPASAQATATTTNQPATVLVFRDGHRSEVQNYAIVGSTLWLLSDTRASKVPLSHLDLNQTVKVNEDRGMDFQVPK